jgi:hypothetical protein
MVGMSERTRAAITSIAAARSGISLAAECASETGIGRIDFVVIDLAQGPSTSLVDRDRVDYAPPLPTHVREEWTSDVTLVPGSSYRAFFHVYDRTGVNLVAYDRRDFTCGEGR